MSLLQGFLKGLEYKRAIEAAVQSIGDGKSLPEIVRSFAIETEGSLDDQWARDVETVLRSTIEKANMASSWMVEASSRSDVLVDKIIALSGLAIKLMKDKVEPGIKDLDVKISNGGRIASDVMSKVGVMAVKVKTRSEMLLADRPKTHH